METPFRFQKLRVWQEAMEIAKDLFLLVKRLNDNKHFGYSSQLERASLSIPNNIAEGSGSSSDKEFANFLNISRRSLFECVNILIIMKESSIISNDEYKQLIIKLISLGKQISSLRNRILK